MRAIECLIGLVTFCLVGCALSPSEPSSTSTVRHVSGIAIDIDACRPAPQQRVEIWHEPSWPSFAPSRGTPIGATSSDARGTFRLVTSERYNDNLDFYVGSGSAVYTLEPSLKDVIVVDTECTPFHSGSAITGKLIHYSGGVLSGRKVYIFDYQTQKLLGTANTGSDGHFNLAFPANEIGHGKPNDFIVAPFAEQDASQKSRWLIVEMNVTD